MAKQKTRMEKKFGGFIFLHTLNITAGSTLAPIGQQGDERGLFIKDGCMKNDCPESTGLYYLYTMRAFLSGHKKRLLMILLSNSPR